MRAKLFRTSTTFFLFAQLSHVFTSTASNEPLINLKNFHFLIIYPLKAEHLLPPQMISTNSTHHTETTNERNIPLSYPMYVVVSSNTIFSPSQVSRVFSLLVIRHQSMRSVLAACLPWTHRSNRTQEVAFVFAANAC